MSHLQSAQARALERYVRTGEYDGLHFDWGGENFVDCQRNGDAALRAALIAAVEQKAAHAKAPTGLTTLDTAAFARERVAPMVRGLVDLDEQEAILNVFSASLVFLVPTNIHDVLTRTPWLGTAWNLANLYLGSIEAELLSDSAPRLLGLSEETTCYVSMEYFREKSQFDDFVVHEAAHIFHNCRRDSIGLPQRRGRDREFLLDIAYAKRETFAYSCEVYSRIIGNSHTRAGRQHLLAQYAQGPLPAASELDPVEHLDILAEAVRARNGWKKILERCAGRKRRAPTDAGTAL